MSGSQLLFKRVGSYVKPSYPIYIGNKAITKTSSSLSVYDKYTGEEVSKVPLADSKLIDSAIQKACESQDALRQLTNAHRKNILLDMATKIKDRADELANAIVVEVGKPLVDAKAEVGRATDTFTVAAEEAVRQYGEYTPLDISLRNVGFSSISKRFPVGPISMIAPFNFPLNLCAHKIAPAIAAGCPFVLKPSDRTPICAMILGEMLSQVGLPDGSFSVFPTELKDSSILSTDPRIKLVSFTGSPAVGWKIKESAGRKKVTLELGGNAACIVDNSVPEKKLDHVANRVAFGGFYTNGQSCISVQRVYVHEQHYDQFKKLLLEKTKVLAARAGDPMDPNCFLGPMITSGDALRLEKWVGDAVSKGAKLLCGGKAFNQNKFFDLTILEDVPSHCDVSCKEVFGPLFIIEKFNDFKKVCNLVNQSEFGLQAGVFTDDIHKSYYAFNNIDVGAVVINDIPSVRVDSQPYGGVKGSGLGREGIRSTIEEYTELKLMIMKDIGVI